LCLRLNVHTQCSVNQRLAVTITRFMNLALEVHNHIRNKPNVDLFLIPCDK